MIKKIVVSLALLVSVASAQDYALNLQGKSSCTLYRGSWKPEDRVSPLRGESEASCILRTGIGGRCVFKIHDPGKDWKVVPFDGNWAETSPGIWFYEGSDPEQTEIKLQLACDRVEHRGVIRFFNDDTKVGMQCTIPCSVAKTQGT